MGQAKQEALMRLVAIVALTVFAAFPVLAADPAPADHKTDQKLICKRIQTTGSHLQTQRVCLTQEEWDGQNKVARDSVHQSQVVGSTKNTGGK
jgi:hypothetical protein